MKGRFLGIKKTTILRLSFIVNLLFFAIVTLLDYLYIKNNNHFFYIFCFFVAMHLINKSILFKFDSSCYFGNILLFISFFFFYCNYLGILFLYPFFILLSFAVASFVTDCAFDEPFHFFLSLSILFASFALLLYLFKFISLAIFLAITGAVVLLLVIRFFTMK